MKLLYSKQTRVSNKRIYETEKYLLEEDSLLSVYYVIEDDKKELLLITVGEKGVL